MYCRDCLRATLRSRPPWNRGACPLCRRAVSVYNTVDMASGSALETPSRATIFGESYLQHGDKGVASYHFLAPDDCYISYERAPAAWVLDDGSRPPARKAFANPRYDEATRTFTGTIDWSDNNFAGDARWEYEMVFADDFVTIAGGQMTGFDSEGNQTRTCAFPDTLRYVRAYELPSAIVGQAYMQGGSLGVASYHFPEIDHAYISYEAAPPQWTLDDGQPPPSRKAFVNPRYDEATRTFTGTIDWSDNNFAGVARWEYEMVFSEDFSRITGGQVRAFGASGEESSVSVFGRDLVYALYVEEQAQLLHLLGGADEDMAPLLQLLPLGIAAPAPENAPVRPDLEEEEEEEEQEDEGE